MTGTTDGRSAKWDAPLAIAAAVLVFLAVALVSLEGASPAGAAAGDASIVRAAGLGAAGAFGGSHAVASALFLWLPLGTRAFRVALASSVLVGAGASAAFGVSRRVLAGLGGAAAASAPAWATLVAALGTLSVVLSPPFVLSAAAGSSASAAFASAFGAAFAVSSGAWVQAAAAALLAFGAEPDVGVAAILAVGVAWVVRASGGEDAKRALVAPATLAAVAAALAPLAYGIARIGVADVTARVARPFFGDASGTPSPLAIAADVGLPLAAVAFVGAARVAVRAFASGGARAAIVPPLVLGAVAATCAYAAHALGRAPSSWSGTPSVAASSGAILVALGAFSVLVSSGMFVVTRAVATAKIPFASASASMIVLLEATFAVVAADRSTVASDAASSRAMASYAAEVRASPSPAARGVVVAEGGIASRISAHRAAGDAVGGIDLVDPSSLSSSAARRTLARDPSLAPLFRDLALSGAATEFALAQTASSRPLYVAFPRGWDRVLARHLVPDGARDRFLPEPRGSSERKKGLDAFAPVRNAIAVDLSYAADPDASAALSESLSARLRGAVAAGDKEGTPRALDDARAFAPPHDPLVEAVAKRLAMGPKAVLDPRDLP